MNAINILITNAGNILKFLKEFTVDSAKDVSITYINADGSESVSTFSNIAKQLITFDGWKNNLESSLSRTYDIFKEFDKVTIHTQSQVSADSTLSNEAVFTIDGFADAKLVSIMLVVNVEGSSNSSPDGKIDIFLYSVGSAPDHKYDQKLIENFAVQGRNYQDNYKDVNIALINQNLSFGIGTFKIVNTGSQYIEIFAVGAKLRK